MTCEVCKKEVTRMRYIPINGKVVGGCHACMLGVNPSTLSTDKRWHHGQGHDFWASPAHLSDIRHRRVAEDGRGIERSYR